MKVLIGGMAAAALLLAGSLIPAAQADDTAQGGEAFVTCPTNQQIDALLGGTTKSSDRQLVRTPHRECHVPIR